jgi:hypothetical protein
MILAIQINFGQNKIESTGNVGIGTTTPLAKLEVRSGDILVKNIINTNNNSSLMIGQSVTDGNLIDTGTSIRTIVQNAGNNTYGMQFFTQESYLTSQTEKVRIQGNGNVGIGTTDPDAKLTVNGNAKLKESLAISGVSGGYTTGDNPVLSFGTINSDFAKISVPFGDKMILSSYHGYTFKTSYNGAVPLTALTIGITGDVGIGTINPDAKLAVNGTIHSKEVKVDVNIPVPDYVFAEDYKLKTLKEVEDYVKVNSHLPEIPSAKEIEKNGLMLAEMNMALLKKIEELTLYTIEQEKKTETIMKYILTQDKHIVDLNKASLDQSERLKILEKKKTN